MRLLSKWRQISGGRSGTVWSTALRGHEWFNGRRGKFRPLPLQMHTGIYDPERCWRIYRPPYLICWYWHAPAAAFKWCSVATKKLYIITINCLKLADPCFHVDHSKFSCCHLKFETEIVDQFWWACVNFSFTFTLFLMDRNCTRYFGAWFELQQVSSTMYACSCHVIGWLCICANSHLNKVSAECLI